MNKYFLVFLLSALTGCTAVPQNPVILGNTIRNGSGSSNSVPIGGDSVIVNSTPIGAPHTSPRSEISRKTDCRDFALETGKDEEYNLINIKQDGVTTNVIKLPTGLSKIGFALNFAKKTNDGFLFSIEYGSRFYYEKEFYFGCKRGGFYLTKVIVRTHDQGDPEESPKDLTMRVHPAVPLDRFLITDYMTE